MTARLGFVGLGWAGRHRMGSLLKSGEAEVVALHDPVAAAAEEARKLAPDAQVASTFQDMLEADVDGIVVSTPNALHAEQCIAALEKGLHVFCQKPLGRDAAEVRRIVEAARKADRVLGVDLCYRHIGGMEMARERIRTGAIGDVFHLDLVFHNAYGPDKKWFYDPVLAGGGCVLDLGIHMVDLGMWAMDFPAVRDVQGRLYAKGQRVRHDGRTLEDYALAQLDFANGATAQVACSWGSSMGRDAVISALFHGTHGAVRVENVGGSYFDFRTELYEGTRTSVLQEPPEDWSGRAILAWTRAVKEGRGFDKDALHHVEVAEVLDQVYRA